MSEETVAAQLYYVNAGDRIRFHKKDTTANATGGGVDNYFDMYADRTNFLKDVRVVTMGTNGTSLTTKDYVDDNFVDLTTTQIIGGAKTFNANDVITISPASGGNAATLDIKSIGPQDPKITFGRNGGTGREILAQGDKLRLAYDSTTYLDVQFNGIYSTEDFRIDRVADHARLTLNADTGMNPYVRLMRDEVILAEMFLNGDNLVLDRVGGATITLTDTDIIANRSLSVDGTLTTTNYIESERAGHSKLLLGANGLDSYYSQIYFTTNQVNKGRIITNPATDEFFVQGYQPDASVGARLSLQSPADGSGVLNANFNCVVEGVTPTADAHLTTKGFSDATYMNKTVGGTLTGNVTMTKPTGDNYLTIISANNPIIILRADGNGGASGRIYANDNLLSITQYTNGVTNNELRLFPTYSISTQPLRGPTPANGQDYTPKDYVDDNVNVVQQAAAYQFVMPTAAPTAGQSLEVGSVSGTTITMVWV